MESDRSEAERWLISYLEDQGGSAAARDIKKGSQVDGLEWRTVQRASQRVAEKAKSGFQGAWVWTLDISKGDTKAPKATRVREPGTFGTFGENVSPLSIIGSTRCAFHPAAEPKQDGSCGICRAEVVKAELLV